MIIGKIVQQPNDVLDYDVDCSSLFIDGTDDEVVSVTASVAPAGLTVTAIVADTSTVKLTLSGGDDGDAFILTFKVTTEQGREKEDEFEVDIVEYN